MAAETGFNEREEFYDLDAPVWSDLTYVVVSGGLGEVLSLLEDDANAANGG